MADIYSAYEAKSRFSELLRKVREGRTVVITYHDEPVAELRPIAHEETIEQRLKAMERAGTLKRATRKPFLLRPIVRRPGALKRFLAERD